MCEGTGRCFSFDDRWFSISRLLKPLTVYITFTYINIKDLLSVRVRIGSKFAFVASTINPSSRPVPGSM